MKFLEANIYYEIIITELSFPWCRFGLIAGVANPTGMTLLFILLVMVVCSQPFVRKSGYFEVRRIWWLEFRL